MSSLVSGLNGAQKSSMSNLLAASGSPTWTPNARFPYLRSVAPFSVLHSNPSGVHRLALLWVPSEAFRIGTTFIAEVQCTGGSTSLSIDVGGTAIQPYNGGSSIDFGSSDGLSTISASRWYAVQVTEGLAVTFQSAGSWNGDGGANDGMTTQNTVSSPVFVQPLNMVELYITATRTIDFASLEIIPGSAARGLRYQEGLDV